MQINDTYAQGISMKLLAINARTVQPRAGKWLTGKENDIYRGV